MSGAFDGLSFPRYMVAGATAGIAEHVAMYPVDTVKTRMQALAHPGQKLHGAPLHRALSSIIKREGFFRLYRGIAAVAASAGPAHALYFTTYEVVKSAVDVRRSEHAPLKTAFAGAAATVVNDALMTPGDVIKQRMQLANSPYSGVWDCASRTYRKEGLRAFFRSYQTTLLMNVPFTAIHFSTYETVKRLIDRSGEDEGLLTQLVAGGTAGGLSAACTNPLDVVKTRLQTDGILDHKRNGASSRVWPMLQSIVRSEGYPALWHGVSARIAFHVPSAAVCWGVYETAKSWLGGGAA